jgi:MerR family copper efflux transcriptional regulator
MKSRAEITIGEAAAAFELPTHVLRHWESIGLVTPHRHANGRRAYAREHLAAIAFVVRNKQAGFSLEDIRKMLRAGSVEQRHAYLRAQMEELDRRARDIAMAKELVAHAMQCSSPDATVCGTFQKIVDEQLEHALDLAIAPRYEPQCQDPSGHAQ